MKKTDATQPIEALDALLGGLEVRKTIPGTRPDFVNDTGLLSDQLAPLLRRLPEEEPPEDLFGAIEAEIDAMPDAAVQTMRAEDGVWKQRTEKVWKKVLAEDPETGRSMYLLRCLPGATIKPHVHVRAEHLFIIEGEFWIDGKLYTAGDAQVAVPGSEHSEISMPNGCLVLVSA